ncbi:MAG: hypothetical protein KDD51_04245 [Bdellovibrionales bacterium]|nr:hypothetical protein [Bdellovibrionales bacterium]
MSKKLKFYYGWVSWGVLCLATTVWGSDRWPERWCPDRVARESLAHRLPWTRPPRTIPGYDGPQPDDTGSYEARQVRMVADIYTRLALDETSLDIFALAQTDERLREISFHLVNAQYLLGLNSLDDLETKPIFVVHASCVARMADQRIALLFNPTHWETDPNLSFSASATALYVMDRLVRGQQLRAVRPALNATLLAYVYGGEPIEAPDGNYNQRDPIERLYSLLYSELMFVDVYGKWTRRGNPQMKTQELEDRYDKYWTNPVSYLSEVLTHELRSMGYTDDTLNQIVATNLLSHPLPSDWPLPELPPLDFN